MTTRANTSQLPLILAVLTILGGFGGAIWGGAVWLNGKFAEEDSKITAATGDHDKRMTDMQRQIDALSAQIKAINIVQPAQTQELVRDLQASFHSALCNEKITPYSLISKHTDEKGTFA